MLLQSPITSSQYNKYNGRVKSLPLFERSWGEILEQPIIIREMRGCEKLLEYIFG
jgi:hypothetical protein